MRNNHLDVICHSANVKMLRLAPQYQILEFHISLETDNATIIETLYNLIPSQKIHRYIRGINSNGKLRLLE